MQNVEEIYRKNFETVYKYLFCLTRDSNISEELTQETFCKAVQKIDTFKGECKMSVWLCQIAKNLWYNQYKKENKTIRILDLDMDISNIPEKDTVENNVVLKEEKIFLYKRMQRIDERSREVVYLRLTGELSFKEIGDILGKTENWARITFYRAKKKIKEGYDYEREKRL